MGIRQAKRSRLLRKGDIRLAQEVSPEIITYRRHSRRYKLYVKRIDVSNESVVLYSIDQRYWDSNKRYLVDAHLRVEFIMETGSSFGYEGK